MRFALVAFLSFLPTWVMAQAAGEWNSSVRLDVRARFEARSNRDFSDLVRDNRQDRFLRTRVNLSAENAEHGLFGVFQGQASTDWFRVAGGHSRSNDFGAHQVYLEWRPGKSKLWSLRGGRQELIFGNERIIGAFGWDNTGRSFDGVRADYTPKDLRVSLLSVQLGDLANRTNRPKLHGAYASWQREKTHTVEVYALNKRDKAAGVRQDIYTIGARSQNRVSSLFDYLAEAAIQIGEIGAKDVEAWAYSMNAGLSLSGPAAPRVYAEYNQASGGPSSNAKSNTFDQLFPTNHDKYGIADYQGWRNMRNLRIGASAIPAKGWFVFVDHHWFWLQDRRDAWYGAGGRPNVGAGGVTLRDATGASGNEVGTEVDVQVNYTHSKQWQFGMGYARFMPGEFVRRVNSRADGSDWWYAMATWRP